jgi:hypothetical protein
MGATSRRRLLTGSAALPIVMTLPTQASAAAFGSTLRCLNSQTEQPADYFTMTATGWATRPLNCIRVALPNGSDPWVIGDFGGGKYFDRTGGAWYPDNRWFKRVGDYSGKKYDVKGYTSANAYVYVYSNGTYAGMDPSLRKMGAVAVYGSCYASISGGIA